MNLLCSIITVFYPIVMSHVGGNNMSRLGPTGLTQLLTDIKTWITTKLGNYVTTDTTQTVTGKKYFTNSTTQVNSVNTFTGSTLFIDTSASAPRGSFPETAYRVGRIYIGDGTSYNGAWFIIDPTIDTNRAYYRMVTTNPDNTDSTRFSIMWDGTETGARCRKNVSTGDLLPYANNTYNLGADDHKWDIGYIHNLIGSNKEDKTEDANSYYSTTSGSHMTFYTTSNGGTKLSNVPAAVNTHLESRTIRYLSSSDWIIEQICHNSFGLYYRKGTNGTWSDWKTFAFTNSNITGTAANVTGTVAIANGGTGATTRLSAVKALTNESVGTPTHFLAITTNWGKAGYTTVAQAKTVLGITGDMGSHSDSEYVHMSGDETVAGVKTFSNNTYITSLNFTSEVESQSSSSSAVFPIVTTVTYADQSPSQTARLNFRITANGDKSLYPHENNQYSFGVTSRRWATLYGYLANLGGTYLGNEASPNERTNLYLLANRDADGQSGAYIGRFRQNRTQGAMESSDVSYITFDFLENSARYTRCFTMGMTDWDSDKVPQTYYLTSPDGKGSLGTATAAWNKVYANSYYLGSTAFGDIVTHNASEFLTEHPSITLSSNTTSTASPAHGGTFTCIDSVTQDTNGHITKVNTKTVTLPSDNNTDTKVKQYEGTTNQERPILSRYNSTEASQTANFVVYDTGVTSNPAKHTITASGGFIGNASSATEFKDSKSVTLTGDVTGTASSKAGWSVATTLANSGVTAGTYGPSADVTGSNNATILVPEITVDAKGRVTAVTNRTYTSVNTDSDKKVYQYYKSDDNVYRLLFSNNAGNTATSNVGAVYSGLNNSFYVNPSTGALYATKLYSGGTEVLTSHQSLDNYVTLNSNQTITAIKTITGGNQGKMVFKNPDYNKGDANESGVIVSRLYFGNGASYDGANAVLSTGVDSSGNSVVELCAINNTANNSSRASLILSYDKSASSRLLKSWGNFLPYVDNTYTLGNSSSVWKECYCNAYYLGTTAFGDIVTHNASEFLTSHQSLSSCVKNVVTNNQTIKSTGITRGTAPSSAQTFGIAFSDNNNKYIGNIYGQYATDKSTYVGLYAYKGTTTSNGDNAYVRVGYDASGNVYTSAPTPATTDNSTQIATTAFVKAQGYLTSHQSLANYVTTNTDQSISGIKSHSKHISILGDYLENEFSTNARTCLYLKSNRDTDGQSGIYFSKYRQNVAQGALTGSNLVSLSLDVLENSVRTNGCIFIQFRYFENDVPTNIYFIPKASATSYMGTADNPWTNAYITNLNLNGNAFDPTSINGVGTIKLLAYEPTSDQEYSLNAGTTKAGSKLGEVWASYNGTMSTVLHWGISMSKTQSGTWKLLHYISVAGGTDNLKLIGLWVRIS